ncbi:MAG: DUF4912 domain-containing protein [Elusimicrobiota bacterium]
MLKDKLHESLPSSNSTSFCKDNVKENRKDAAPQSVTQSLPSEYGETLMVVMARDPFWMFSYWEIANDKRDEFKKRFGDNVWFNSQLTLRVYDITDVEFNGSNAHSSFDVPINNHTDNWYINVNQANRDYILELGIKIHDGTFVPIVRSNMVMMPRYGVSPYTDEQWGVLEIEFERILKLSGIDRIGKSSEVARGLIERWKYLMDVNNKSLSSIGISSWSRREKLEDQLPQGPVTDFWLIADTELVVHGKTEPDAEVTVAGINVKLNPDGTFSARISLTEGQHEVPVVAHSPHKRMTRQVVFKVDRKTVK